MKALRIVIVAADSVVHSEAKQVAGALGCQIVGEATTPEDGLRLIRRTQPDQVLLQPSGKAMSLLDILAGESEIPVVAVLLPQEQQMLDRVVEAGAAGIVFAPLGVLEMAPVLMVAANNFKRVASLQQQYRQLQDELETRKLVDRAKGKIMSVTGVTEEEAYRWLQKKSMDTQRSLKRLATDLLKNRLEITNEK